jgi:hypothetical protein
MRVHRIRIRKQMKDVHNLDFRMWVGKCSCGMEWQFWFFGATLGWGLEHLRRCERFGALSVPER